MKLDIRAIPDKIPDACTIIKRAISEGFDPGQFREDVYNPGSNVFESHPVHYLKEEEKQDRELLNTVIVMSLRWSDKERQVGCEDEDGLLIVHSERETCEVCEQEGANAK